MVIILEENNTQNTNKKPIWIVYLVIAAVLSIAVFLITQNKGDSANTSLNLNNDVANQTNETIEQSTVIEVEGGSMYFKPNEIRVKLGESVKIKFTNAGGMHDFVIDEFNVKTKVLGSGKTETVEFTADKLGEFEFYCSVAGHRQSGMFGKIIVEE